MRTDQIISCILACICVAAAAIVGAFLQNLVAVICLMLGAVICGGAMFFLRNAANEKEEQQARKNRPDFMNPPKEEDKTEPQDKDL